MKLALIFTGGTISGEVKNNSVSPSQKTKSILTEALDKDIFVESFQPYYILSEQLDGEYLTKLISCIGKRLAENFDGIIITHGTDTLQYSAAAAAIAFGESKIPVVFVSSNYILSDSRSNGLSNFKYAVKFIKEKIGGVFVSYKNENHPEFFLADSLLSHSPYSDKLTSVSPVFGYFENDSFKRTLFNYQKRNEGIFTLTKKSHVLWIKAYPGMEIPNTDGYKAVLIESYHSGTLPTADAEFIGFCKNSSVPIYICGVSGEIEYESMKVYEQLNVVVLKKTSPIYAYISLWKDL